MKRIKYTSETSTGVCDEKLPGCDLKSGTVHVCFEDGSGATVCKNCFDHRLNTGTWITDSGITIQAV